MWTATSTSRLAALETPVSPDFASLTSRASTVCLLLAIPRNSTIIGCFPNCVDLQRQALCTASYAHVRFFVNLAKVGDFGNSRLRSTQLKPRQHKPSAKQPAVDGDFTKSLTVGVGTPLWMAPELLRRATREYGKEVDIYSFAIVQWEVRSHLKPVSGV